MNEHERGLLEFLEDPMRRRMATLLEFGARRRGEVRALLDHGLRFKPALVLPFTGSDGSLASIDAALRKRGAPDACHVMSADSDLDAREMRLGEALTQIVGMGNGALVSCIPGRLGFYEGEAMRSSCLLSS